MDNTLYQSTASQRVYIKAFLSSDHVSPATGKTIAVVISKNGGAFANPNAGATNATEISNGWYYVTVDATDTGTLGEFVVRGTEGTIDPAERIFKVVAATNAGFTGIPAIAAGASGGLPTVDANNSVKVQSQFKKNVALSNFSVFMVLSSDGSPATGKVVAVEISKDDGGFGAATNSPATELSDGYYSIDLTQAEMNANKLDILGTNADCRNFSFTLYTDP